MTIYDSSGKAIYIAPVTKDAIIKNTLMEEYYIELSFNVIDVVPFGRGCYILHKGRKFEIMSNVHPEPLSSGNGYHYTLRFESQQSQMKRCKVFWRGGDNLEVSFSDTTSLDRFGDLIITNVNAFLGSDNWSLGNVPEDLKTTMKTISFSGDSCWDAVSNIAEAFGVEWWTEEDGDKVSLCFGKLELGDAVEFRKGDVVSSIPSKRGDDANYGTRFYVFGSTKNLPEDYGTNVEGGVTNNVVEKRLHLPDGMQYIDARPNLAHEDIIEQVVFFEDVMPTNVETITEVYSGNAEVIPGTSHKVYDVVCANSPFSLDDIIEGETIQANFTSGSLNGQTFDLDITQTSGAFNKIFRIVPKILDRDSLTILPQGEMIPRAGDTFILLNVNLPQGRIEEAEQRLLEVGQEYVKKNSSDTEIYDCPTNAVYCHKNDCNYMLGQRVTLVGDKFGASGRESRIQGYEKKLYDEYQATYTVGDNSAYSRLASLEKSIQQATYSDRVGLEANIIRSKNDSTIPSDFNIYSALAVEEYFLSKRKGGTVKGHTDFTKGISLYGKPIYDEEKKSWILKGDLLVTGAITMYGLTEGYKPSTIMDAVKVDGNTIIKENGVLKINPNINLGGGSGGGIGIADVEYYLTTNGYATQDWVTGKGYITSSALEPYAPKTSIPTNTNQLTNGAGYITGITSSMVTTALGYTPVAVNTRLTSAYNNAIGYGYVDGGWPEAGPAMVFGAGNYKAGVHIGALGSAIRYGYTAGTTPFTWRTILDDNNYSDYALPLTGGKINGDLEVAGCLYSSGENLRIRPRGASLAGVEIALSDTDYWQISHRGSFANNELHFYHNANGTWSNSVLSLISDGSVIVGNNLLIKGAVTMYYSSDERLKKNIRKVNASEVLMSLGGVWQYEYIDSEVVKNSTYGGLHFGLIYQNVKGTALKSMCHEREDGFGTLNYLDTNFISLIAGATMEHCTEIEKLKKENKALRKEVELLKQRVA